MALYGGIDSKENYQPLELVNTEYLTNCFSRNLLEALLQAGEIEHATIDLIRSWEHSGFHTYVGDPIQADQEETRLFTARYLKKSAVANSRLELIEDAASPMVRIHKNTENGSIYRDLDPLDFLANLVMHVPGRREQTVRYLGKYSARSRGAERLALDTPGPLPETDPPQRTSASWARCMAQVFEFEPLRCPKCGGAMQIKAFLHDQNEITRLAKHLGIQPWRAPPPMPSPLKQAA
jgi:hypothetical protein